MKNCDIVKGSHILRINFACSLEVYSATYEVVSVQVMFRISVIWQPLEPDTSEEEQTSHYESADCLDKNNREAVNWSSLPIRPLRSLPRPD